MKDVVRNAEEFIADVTDEDVRSQSDRGFELDRNDADSDLERTSCINTNIGKDQQVAVSEEAAEHNVADSGQTSRPPGDETQNGEADETRHVNDIKLRVKALRLRVSEALIDKNSTV